MTEATTFTYNGITLDHVLTRSLVHEPIFDDSGADYLYTRIALTVQGLITPSLNDDAANPVTLNSIRDAFSEPRKALLYKLDETEVINTAGVDAGASSSGSDFEWDAAVGPKIINFNVIEIQGCGAILVEVTAETHLRLCSSSNPPTILSNRWSMTHDIDTDFRSTRTVRGVLVISSNLNGVFQEADAFRTSIVPRVPKGFRRESINIEQSSEGAKLNYTIVDKEIDIGIPDPLTRWEGTYAENIENWGTKTIGEISVKVFGQQTATGDVLLNKALEIAYSRFKSGIDVVQSGSFSETLHKREVEVRLRFIKGMKSKSTADLAFTTSRVGAKLDGIPEDLVSTDIGDRGAYVAQLWANHLKTACSKPNDLTQARSSISSFPSGVDSIGVNIIITNSPATDAGGEADTTAEHQENPYIDYQLASKYETIESKFHMSRAGGDTHTEMVQIARPRTRLRVRFKGQRVGKLPVAPEPKDVLTAIAGGIDAKLLDRDIVVSPGELMADGTTKFYTIQGEYVYGLDKGIPNTGSIKTLELPSISGGTLDVETTDYNDIFA